MAIQEQLDEEIHNSSIRDNSVVYQVPQTRLPALKLQTFSEKYSEYKNFITSFRQIIDKECGLSNIQKFNHLLNCLQGQALETVKAFQVTNENYPKALERLNSRYDNNTLIFMENITTLFELQASTKQNCIELRSLIDNVSALGTDKQISNAMLIYLIMQKVDKDTQKKWKESLDFTTLPTWEDCVKMLERRCQYLESVEPTHQYIDSARKTDGKGSKRFERHQSHGNNYAFTCIKRSCKLCEGEDHSVSNCQRYKSMTIAECFDNVKTLGLCIIAYPQIKESFSVHHNLDVDSMDDLTTPLFIVANRRNRFLLQYLQTNHQQLFIHMSKIHHNRL